MQTYIIKTNVSDLYKIGRSNNVSERINHIKGSMNFVDIKIIHLFDYDCEKALHNHFSKNRTHGEWFEFTDNEVSAIRTTDWSLCCGLHEADDFVIEYAKYKGVRTFEIKSKLSASARLLYDYIKHHIINTQDCFKIDREHFASITGLSSQTTFISAKKELLNAEILLPSDKSFYGWFYINEGFLYES